MREGCMKGVTPIARQVSRLRYQRGWTQDELADRSQAENGSVRIWCRTGTTLIAACGNDQGAGL